MTMESKTLFPVEVVHPPAPELDVYVVFAYWREGWWKMFPVQFDSYVKASDFARNLGGGYGKRVVFHLNGEST